MNKTAERRYGIIKVLSNANTRISGDILAERFGVSRKTIDKDIQKLEDLGYLFDKADGHHGGFVLQNPDLDIDYILFEQNESNCKEFLRIEISEDNSSDEAQRLMTYLRKVLIERTFK